MIALGTSDISAAQTAGAHCLDALCGNGRTIAGAHGIAHALLHGTAEGHTVLQLTSDVLSNQLSVGSSALDLDDIDDNGLAILLGQLVLQCNALFAALADDHARLSAVDIDGHTRSGSGRIHSALDLDLGDASVLQLSLQLSADLVILDEVIAEILLGGKPAAVPVFNNADTNAVRIYFLAHCFPSLLFLFQNNGHVAGALQDAVAAALCTRHHALQRRAGADVALGDVEVVLVHIEVVFRICGCRLHQLQKGLTSGLRGVLQDCQRFVQGLVTDQIHNDGHLTRTNAGITKNCPSFHVVFLPLLLRITSVALEGTGGNELTQLVANHVLSHIHRHMLAAVVDGKGVTNEFGEDRGGAAPGLDDLLLAGSVHRFNVLHKSSLDERSFFNASTHCLKLLSYLPARFTISLSERL